MNDNITYFGYGKCTSHDSIIPNFRQFGSSTGSRDGYNYGNGMCWETFECNNSTNYGYGEREGYGSQDGYGYGLSKEEHWRHIEYPRKGYGDGIADGSRGFSRKKW